MTAVMRHPHIDPPVEVAVPDDRVASHLAAGWLLVESEPEQHPDHNDPDPEPTGEDHEMEQG